MISSIDAVGLTTMVESERAYLSERFGVLNELAAFHKYESARNRMSAARFPPLLPDLGAAKVVDLLSAAATLPRKRRDAVAHVARALAEED
jgi:hypothetical protein